jgi:hypothetical protein
MTIRLEDVEGDTGSFEVLGVMPAGFTYPVGAARATDVWVPYGVPATQRVRSLTSRVPYLKVIARLNAGESVVKAQAQMDSLAAVLERTNPEWNKNRAFRSARSRLLSSAPACAGDRRATRRQKGSYGRMRAAQTIARTLALPDRIHLITAFNGSQHIANGVRSVTRGVLTRGQASMLGPH